MTRVLEWFFIAEALYWLAAGLIVIGGFVIVIGEMVVVLVKRLRARKQLPPWTVVDARASDDRSVAGAHDVGLRVEVVPEVPVRERPPLPRSEDDRP